MINSIVSNLFSTTDELCGAEPSGFIDVEIGSDPNFIFVPDSSYVSRNLYDSENNTVIVNSYLECKHYVDGGWDILNQQLNESFFHNALYIFSLLGLLTSFIILKYLKNE